MSGKLVLWFAVGAAVGAGGATAWRTADSPAAPPPLEAPAAAPPAAAPEAAGPVDAAPVRPAAGPPTAANPGSVPPPAGDRTIRGRITDASGAPVAGVVVYARRTPGDLESTRDEVPPATDDAQHAFEREAMAEFQRTHAIAAFATSDAAGAYALRGLDGSLHTVAGWKPGVSVTPVAGVHARFSGVHPDAVVDLVAVPADLVRIDLSLPDGTVPAQAVVRIADSSGTREGVQVVRWSPERSTVQLAGGGYVVTAAAHGATADWEQAGRCTGDFASKPSRINVLPGSGPQRIALELTATCVLRVSAETSLETTRLGLRFSARALAAGEAPDVEKLRGWGRETLSGVRDGGVRRVTFYDLAPGRYLVAAYRSFPMKDAAGWQVVDVKPGFTEATLDCTGLDAPPRIRVRALDAAGKPIPHARFYLSGGGAGTWAYPIKVFDDGTYVLQLDADIAKAWRTGEGRWVLELRHPEFSGISASISRDSAQPIVLSDGSQATVKVRLAAPENAEYAHGVKCLLERAGADLEELQMSLWRDAMTQRASGEPADDAEPQTGPWELGPVSVGRYDLVIFTKRQGAGGPHAWQLHHHATLTLEPGAREYVVPAPERHTLTVRAPGSHGLQLTLHRRRESAFTHSRHRARVRDGRAEFRNLLPGRYYVGTLDTKPADLVEVVVPDTLDVVFERDAPNALRVPEKLEGWFAESGFVADDLIIGIGETDFPHLDRVHRLSESPPAGDLALRVLRGEPRAVHVVTVNAAEFLARVARNELTEARR